MRRALMRFRAWGFFPLAMLGLALLSSPLAQGADPTIEGARIYQRKCARCHGPSGEGTEQYARVLVGDRGVASLTKLIAKTMPEDAPGECVGAEAAAVAQYIHAAFYSREAQARRKDQAPRIELARLTVRQYRESVLDLIGSFRESLKQEPGQGLRGAYSSRGGRGQPKTMDRLDPEIAFQFGSASPIPAQKALEPLSKQYVRLPVLPVPLSIFPQFSQAFHVTWRGSVEAVESGEHEFLIRTENAARLWVNDEAHALIDAGVKSGDVTEYRGSIRMIAGRRYPIRLEYFRTRGEKGASLSLLWKQPGGVFEVIPARRLSPGRVPEVLVLATPFPPDDRSMGYERGTSISRAWDQATTEVALEIADYVAAHLAELAHAPEGVKDRAAKIQEFCTTFVERALRRPLTPEQRDFYVLRQFAAAADQETAVKRVVILALKSPRFLYREAGRSLDDFDAAARLSFALWDSLPDQTLWNEALAGRLKTREQIRAQAERMVRDPRAQTKLCLFLLRWLRVDPAPELVKDRQLYPQFNESIAADLRTSLRLFLEELAQSPNADLRTLLCSESVYLNGRLSQIYGGSLAADAPFQKVVLEPGVRSGVLTHPYLAANFAYTGSTSPIHRGVFVCRSVLGRVLMPPPEAVAPIPANLHPGLTTRERVALQTQPKACVACHGLINPLGFTLERFDAIGRYRTHENGKAVDSTGAYETLTGETRSFDGARALGEFLASSEETRRAFVSQLFHALVQQPIRAFGPETPAKLSAFFSSHEGNIKQLMIEIMATSALTPRRPSA